MISKFPLSLVLLLSALTFQACAEEPKPPEDKPGADKKADDRAAKRELRKKEAQQQGDQPKDIQRGGPGMGRDWGGPRGGPFIGMIERDIRAQMGLDTPIQLNQIPMAFDRRMAFKIPVGGIENFDEMGDGAKVEEVFALTPEQTKSLDTLRDEYKTELDAMQKRLDDVNKAMADQIKDLRKKFELKANDVLTGDAKTGKEKLDAVREDWQRKREALAKEQQPKHDEILNEAHRLTADKLDRQAMQDFIEKTRENIRVLREASFNLAHETTGKMKDALSGEAKANLELALLKFENRHQRMKKDGNPKDPAQNHEVGKEKKIETGGINAEKPVPAPDF